MRVGDLLIAGGTVLVSAQPPAVVDDAAVVVVDGAVVDLGPRAEVSLRWTCRSVLDASGAVVSPGFVDAHVHLAAPGGFGRSDYAPSSEPGVFVHGGHGPQISPIIGGMVNRRVDPAAVQAVAAVRMAAMLLCGYTGVVDAGGPAPEAVAGAAATVGIRAAVGPSLADSWHNPRGTFARRVDTDTLLAEAASALDRLAARTDSTVRPIVSVAGTLTSSDELLRGVAALAAEKQLPVHVHSHVSRRAVHDHDAAFGRAETSRLSEAGLLNADLIVMHAGAVADDDLQAFADAGVTVNYNPVGNALFGFGVSGADTVRRAVRAGVRVAFGSDWSSAVTPPGELVRAALMFQRDDAADDTALHPHEALAASFAPVAVFGSETRQVGCIAPGHVADLVVTDVTGPHHLDQAHPVTALAWHARPDDIRAVIVAGRTRVLDGRLVDVDIADLQHAARHASADRSA